MPVYDFECEKCGNISEHIMSVNLSGYNVDCPKCSGMAHKIISASGAFCANEDAAWIRSVREVVDKEGGVASQRFLRDPTRVNYKRWMKDTGIRPLESGESRRPAPTDEKKLTREVMRMRQKRNKITIN